MLEVGTSEQSGLQVSEGPEESVCCGMEAKSGPLLVSSFPNALVHK